MNHPMRAAIVAAREGLRQNRGGPFGACIARRGRIVAVAHNTVLGDRDPTAHAEINAIRRACRRLKTRNLSGCVLYATSEPCPMCLAAIYWARIDEVRVGVPARVAARAGFDDALIYRELARPAGRRRIRMRRGVMAVACRKLFKEWKERGGKLY